MTVLEEALTAKLAEHGFRPFYIRSYREWWVTASQVVPPAQTVAAEDERRLGGWIRGKWEIQLGADGVMRVSRRKGPAVTVLGKEKRLRVLRRLGLGVEE